MLNRFSEYRLQLILALLQVLVILAGCLWVGTSLKAVGLEGRLDNLPLRYSVIRNWGFLLILLSLVWVIVSIWLEENRRLHFSKRATVISGIAVALIMGGFLFVSGARLWTTIIQAAP